MSENKIISLSTYELIIFGTVIKNSVKLIISMLCTVIITVKNMYNMHKKYKIIVH